MPSDPSRDDTRDERQVQARAAARAALDQRRDEALRWLMDDRRGRLLMWQRLTDAGLFRSSMAASPELTAFHEGRRDVGLQDLARIMRLCPAHYARMSAEAHADVPTDGANDERF